jgi:hypothetical protein
MQIQLSWSLFKELTHLNTHVDSPYLKLRAFDVVE